MIATADCCKEDPLAQRGGPVVHAHMDSDSEDEGNTGVMHHHPLHATSSSGGPFSLVLDDLRRMEYPLPPIEEILLRDSHNNHPHAHKKDKQQQHSQSQVQQAQAQAQAQQQRMVNAAMSVGHSHAMAAVNQADHPNAGGMNMLSAVPQGVSVSVPVNVNVPTANNNAFLSATLIGRSGHCCLLTDSQDFTVRRHQLKVLSEEFSDVDFVKFIESSVLRCPGGSIIAYNAVSAQMSGKMKQLLVRLMELERSHADGVMTCKQKDFVRAMDIIPGVAERGNEADETVMRARIRAEEISNCVHRLLSQL
jgi:hypothetical protein